MKIYDKIMWMKNNETAAAVIANYNEKEWKHEFSNTRDDDKTFLEWLGDARHSVEELGWVAEQVCQVLHPQDGQGAGHARDDQAFLVPPRYVGRMES